MAEIGFDVLVKETDEAYLIRPIEDDTDEYWLPKSEVTITLPPGKGHQGTLDIPLWLVEREGLEPYLIEDDFDDEGDDDEW